MDIFYKLLLTFNATSWMFIIFVIKEKWSILSVPSYLFGVILLIIPIFLSWLTLSLSKRLGKETGVFNCKDFSLADGEFLPVYLGYFFVSLSVSDYITMLFVYSIVFVFTFLSQTQYYNPIFLLFGYHFYHISTENDTKIFVIKKGIVIRKTDDMKLENLYRLNDSTFIERG